MKRLLALFFVSALTFSSCKRNVVSGPVEPQLITASQLSGHWIEKDTSLMAIDTYSIWDLAFRADSVFIHETRGVDVLIYQYYMAAKFSLTPDSLYINGIYTDSTFKPMMGPLNPFKDVSHDQYKAPGLLLLTYPSANLGGKKYRRMQRQS
jgi:hypothetical protein